MGACCVTNEDKKLSTHISKQINNDKKRLQDTIKILFLGSGGAGKSTIFKQLKCLHGQGFDDNYKKAYIEPIISQIVNQMKISLNIFIGYKHRNQPNKNKNNKNTVSDDNTDIYDDLYFLDDLKLQTPEITNISAANTLLKYKYNKREYKLDENIISSIKLLWKEPVIQEIYKLRNITKIETSSAYFWDKIDEITNFDEYLPTEQDILFCRFKTKHIHEQDFFFKNNHYKIIDVGGQRSQRRKWIHCFEHVVAVIFVASLSCYNELLDEDLRINAMEDQFELFNDICNNQTLSNTTMILFLNKSDLFRNKYKKNQISLDQCSLFNEYKHDDEYSCSKAIHFIQNKFKSLNQSKTRDIICHTTCAMDRKNVQKVFKDVAQILVNQALQTAGLTDGKFVNWIKWDDDEDDLKQNY